MHVKIKSRLEKPKGFRKKGKKEQEVNNSSAIVAEAQVPQDEFVKIDPTELPQAVMQTLAKDYEGASVKEAYVKETEETTLYKIIIVTQDGQEAETLLNEKGEIVKE